MERRECLPCAGAPAANLHVVTDALATQIIVEARRAVGIKFRQGNVERDLRARRKVLVAAGALQSPQLLMVSGIGPAAHLRELGIEPIADLPVGNNLHDHPDITINRRVANTDLLGFSFVGGIKLLRAIRRWRRERRGVLTSNFAEAGAFIRTLPELNSRICSCIS